MLSQPVPPPTSVTSLPPAASQQATQIQDSSQKIAEAVNVHTVAVPSAPETIPSQFSTDNFPEFSTEEKLPDKAADSHVIAPLPSNLSESDLGSNVKENVKKNEIVSTPGEIQEKAVLLPLIPQATKADKTTNLQSSTLQQSAVIIDETQAKQPLEDNKNNAVIPAVPPVEKVNETDQGLQPPIPEQTAISTEKIEAKTSLQDTKNNNVVPSGSILQNIIAEAENLLLGVIINGREVGSLDVIPEGNNLLIPLEDFAKITGITIESIGEDTKLKTPLGEVNLSANELRKIQGVTYISNVLIQEKLLTNLELKVADLTLIVDLPWQRTSGQGVRQEINLQPEVRPPSAGLSNLRQELQFIDNSGNTSWRSSTLLGGRIAGGSWRLRLDNNFENQPNLTEYFFFKRENQFLYQIGKQQFLLNPLFSGLNFTGLQLGYTNLPTNSFNTSSSANEILPRRYQALQTFRGVVPPASFVQLRVGGAVIAQQQVGLSGEYEFQDVRLGVGQSSNIELFVFDRNNRSVPIEVRSLTLNASDLLLPPGGNVQLAGLGVTGNWVQNNLFDDFNTANSGEFTSFYQVRQGISRDLTLEAGVQVLPNTTQVQGGFAWRLLNPLILSANVGTSDGEVAYKADLDFQLQDLRILGSSEVFPGNYSNAFFNRDARDRYNHSVEAKYKFGNDLTLGLIARSYQNQNQENDYILPSFYFRPISTLSLSGSPNYVGTYSFNATYLPNSRTRMFFNSYGDIYTSDLSYSFDRQYQLSFGTESGGDLPTRYTLTLARNASSLSGLSLRLGIGYREDEIGAIAGASMRVLPGLYASIDYQGIPSRNKDIFGGIGDDRLTVSLVSDLSFSGGRITPADNAIFGKERGGIAGRLVVEGGRKGADLSGATIQVFNNQGRSVGGGIVDPQGNFFVGNLLEGVYVVQLDPGNLPLEVTVKKTAVVAEVASSAVTNLDFPVQLEYGLAGRITDATGQPIPELEVELVNTEGKKISSSATDEFGLYRLDGVPAGKYVLQIPTQERITNTEGLPKRDVTIDGEFLFDQNLQLPITPVVKEDKEDKEPVTAQ